MARRIQTILLGACLAFSSSSSLFADAWGFSPSRSRVFTTSGIVYGHSAPNASNVTEYLGIPYAQPPVGSLRFADPQAYSNRSRIIDGSAFAADCPTTNPGKYITNLSNAEWWATSMLYGDKPSEDCLFLNIWTPSGAKGNEGRGGREGREKGGLLPVMVWIYGGGFRGGGTNTSLYSGQYFAADEDVIVVNFNYRVNIFGFSGAVGQTQNPGLLDQRLAVTWVRDNIAAFGGDPDRITLFGESAGSISVGYYLYLYQNDPIIAGAIMESGTPDGLGNAKALSTVEASWDNVTVSLGCGNASASQPDAVIACMRSANITTSKILSAAEALGGSPFYPAVDNVTVFQNYVKQAQSGNLLRKPLLIGNNNFEAGFFEFTGAITDAAAAAFDNNVLTCPTSAMAAAYAAQHVPVWRYYYTGMYPNLLLPTVNLSQAYHTSEIPIVFGTTEDATGKPNTPVEQALSVYMRKAWAAFARNPQSGLTSEMNWPEYTNTSQSLVLLGQNNSTTAAFAYPSSVDYVCPA